VVSGKTWRGAQYRDGRCRRRSARHRPAKSHERLNPLNVLVIVVSTPALQVTSADQSASVKCEIAAAANVAGPYARTLEDAGYGIHRLSPLAPRLLAIAEARDCLAIFRALDRFPHNLGFTERPYA
jgi:hypothetical protein